MKRPLITFLLVVILSIFAACGSQESSSSDGNNNSSAENEETKVIKVANFYAEDHAVNKALSEKFKSLVEENSNGTLEVEIYPNSQLGGEEQMWDSVQNGTIEMAEIGVIMESEVPKVGLLTLPFLFKSYEHAEKVLNSEIGDEIGANIEEVASVKFLGYGINGFRSFSSNRPIEKMEDFKGYKLRSANIPQLIEMSESMGATVTPMPISEIFAALEQGVVDGQENPISTLRSNGWYEVQTDVLESQHVFLPNTIMMNRDFWESLTEEEQEIVQEAVDISAEYEWELFIESEDEDKKFLEDNGITITKPDDSFKEQMIEATEDIYTKFYEKFDWGEETVKRIKELE